MLKVQDLQKNIEKQKQMKLRANEEIAQKHAEIQTRKKKINETRQNIVEFNRMSNDWRANISSDAIR